MNKIHLSLIYVLSCWSIYFLAIFLPSHHITSHWQINFYEKRSRLPVSQVYAFKKWCRGGSRIFRRGWGVYPKGGCLTKFPPENYMEMNQEIQLIFIGALWAIVRDKFCFKENNLNFFYNWSIHQSPLQPYSWLENATLYSSPESKEVCIMNL